MTAAAREAVARDGGPLRVTTVVARLEGGAGQQVLRGARCLDPERVDVTLVAGSGDLLAEARDRGLRVRVEPSLRAPLDPMADLQALRSLERTLASTRPDVVHTHCSKAGVLGRVAARRASTAAIVHTYHGFGFHDFQPAPLRAAYVQAERAVGRVTDLALCVGGAVAAEAARRRLLDPERIRTIGVAVDERFTAAAGRTDPAARERARRRLGLPDGVAVVGAVGRLTYQKAPEDFVALLAALGRSVVGVWVGGGELAGRVGDLARRRDVRLVLTGERHDVDELLAGFDVLALTSRYEGLPTVLVEAMLCDVPVVATDVNAVGDVVVSGRTGLLVPPGRPAEAADAVRRVLVDHQLAERLAAGARRRVEGRFTIEVLREQLVAAYEAVAPAGCAGSLARAHRAQASA